MTQAEAPADPLPAKTVRTPWTPSAPATGMTTGVTAYGCTPDEAALFRTLAPRSGVLPTITEAPPSETNVVLALGDRCVSVGHGSPVTPPILRALSRAGVRYVSARSVGLDHIDVGYAASVGIRVEAISYSPDSVADYTLMLLLMALRRTRSVLRRADAHDFRLEPVRGRELRDLTVGVVGTGRIGSAVVGRLRGFGCRVLTHDVGAGGLDSHVPLDELVQHSDVVTLHVPLTAGTHHLLDRRRIDRMVTGAVVVNTARGGLVDTAALLAALEAGRLGGAALDVLEGEEGVFYEDLRERPIGHDLLPRLQALPNVVVSPHTAFHTDHALADMVENTLAACLAFEHGTVEHGALEGVGRG